MKNKTLVIILIILVLILIGWTIWVKPKAPVIQPGTSSPVTGTHSTSSGQATTSSPTSTNSSHPAPVTIPAPVRLAGGTHVTTTNLSVGQKLYISLQYGSDGGYSIDPVQYNSEVLNLVSQTSKTSGAKGVVGSSPTDTFEFVAIKSGTTGITITQSRPFQQNSTLPLFSGAVSVK